MTIGVGTFVELNGRDFRVLRGRHDGVLQMEACDDGSIMNMNRIELMERIFEGRAQIPRKGEHQYPEIFSDPTALPEYVQDKVARRLKYVNASLRMQTCGQALDVLQDAIQKVAHRIEDPEPPGKSTVWRWRQTYLEAGKDIRALIDRTDLKGNRKRRLDNRVLEIIRDVISEKYLVMERPSLASVESAIHDRIDVLNQRIPKSDHLKYPSSQALYRELERFEPYEVLKARYGKREADYRMRSVGAGVVTERPLERVEIDHTPIDIILVDDIHGMPLGRPTLTLLIDHYSRMPLGYYLGFKEPSRHCIMIATRMAIAPKNWIREEYPDIVNDWPCCGMPEAIVTDNGLEFHSADFERACDLLNINIEHTRVKEPWAKGVVERFFKEVNHTLIGSMPGKTFHSPAARGDYDSVGRACIGFSVFKEIFCTWLVDKYVRSWHSGINAVPIERWEQGTREHPVRPFANSRDLDCFLSFITLPRQIHEYGVVFKHIRYQSERLQDIRRRTKNRVQVSIKINPENLGEIVVVAHETNEMFRVQAMDQEYAESLPLWQHKVNCRVLRDNQTNTTLTEGLKTTQRRIDELVAEQEAKNGRRRTNKAYGRYIEENEQRLRGASSGMRPSIPDEHPYDEYDADYDDDFDVEDDELFFTTDMSRIHQGQMDEEFSDEEE
ncbi:MAG: transposase family protein [Rhodospirillales bacterium]|nr:transposase family protein [Rhodospirillales bacterium]